MKPFKIIALLIIGFLSNVAFSQINPKTTDNSNSSTTDSTIYTFKMNDNSELYGKIVKEDPRETTILLTDGRTVIIPSYLITSKTIAQNSTKINGSYTFKNPHPSRYFYSPTALPMEKNELYIQSVYFLTAQVQYGITENFSAGITTSFLLSPIAITAKYSMKLDDKNHFAIGGLAGSLSWIDNESYLGLGFASYTYGTAESNITLAAGAAQIMDSDLGYVLNAGAHKRLSKHVSIMGEVWYLPEEELIIGGPFLRMYFNKTSCWDLGIIVIQDIALPAFSYTYKFNQN